MFSSKLSTAVHILLYIEKYEQEEKITSEVLADTTGGNAIIIRKILGKLKKAQLVSVKPGVGGSYLAKKPDEITLKMIFQADMLSDMEAVKLSDLYRDMKKKLAKE